MQIDTSCCRKRDKIEMGFYYGFCEKNIFKLQQFYAQKQEA